MRGVSHVSPCFAFRYKPPAETSEQYVARLAAELEAEFQRIGPDKVIGFVAEPIVGATSGCVAAAGSGSVAATTSAAVTGGARTSGRRRSRGRDGLSGADPAVTA